MVSVFHMLKEHVAYKELGAAWLDTRDKDRVIRGLVDRLRSLGQDVTLRPASISGAVA
jgi:predicted AAA+ superfamily ATPase